MSSAQQLADRYAGILVANPLLTSAEAEARLRKVLGHAESHARRPLLSSQTQHVRTVPIPPRRKKQEFLAGVSYVVGEANFAK